MHYLRVFLGIIWKIVFVTNGFLLLLIGYPLFFILLSRKEWFDVAFRLTRFATRLILLSVGVIHKVDYRYNIKENDAPAVYCSNHISYLDVLSVYRIIPHYFAAMGKKELGSVPLLSIFFKKMNILVDRKSIRSAHKAFIRSCDEIDKGHSVFIFPEGGIFNNTGKLTRFKNGAFKLAIEKQVPIVPITLLNNAKLLQHGVLTRTYARPGIARAVVHPPIATVGMTENDLVPLRNRVHAIIAKELENYNKSYENR